MSSADYWIHTLGLKPHPEGGYYTETYRSREHITSEALPGRYEGQRCFGTAIYFLLKSEENSKFHRLKMDEIWHFYSGSPITVHCIGANGQYQAFKLGPVSARQTSFQVVIPAGCWFGATVDQPQTYALVGCTVAPGFEFSDFELGARHHLLEQFPHHRQIIEQLTANPESHPA